MPLNAARKTEKPQNNDRLLQKLFNPIPPKGQSRRGSESASRGNDRETNKYMNDSDLES